MQEQRRRVDSSESARVSESEQRVGWLRSVYVGSLVLTSVVVIAGLYLTLSLQGDAPSGADTPFYVWRSRVVAEQGLAALPADAKAFRAGLPVLAGFAHSLTGIGAWSFAFILPPLAAVLVGLAAGSFGVRSLSEPRWAFPVFAIGTAGSVFVVITSVSHMDNMLVDGLLLAALVPALAASEGVRSVVAAAILLAAGAVTHWPFTALLATMLLVVGLVLLPASIRAWREGSTVTRTQTGGVASVVALGSILAATVFALALEAPTLPEGWESTLATKLDRDLPRVAVWIPAAVLGIAALLTGDRRRRRALILLLGWALVAAGAVVAATSVPIPAHRVLHFALAVPLLSAAGLVWLARVIGAVRPQALWRIVSGLLLIGLVVAGGAHAMVAWNPPPARRAELTRQLELAGAYLQESVPTGPVVFVVNRRDYLGARNAVRAGLPVSVIPRAYVYVGDTERLLEGEPTLRPDDPTFNATSLFHWQDAREVAGREAVVMTAAALNPPRIYEALSGEEISPGVKLIRGPEPIGRPVASAENRLSPPSVGEGAVMLGGVLLLLGIVGVGWALSLLPASLMGRLVLSPALGAATLTIAGIAAGRLRLDTPGHRWWIAALVAIVGWSPLIVRRIRGSRALREV